MVGDGGGKVLYLDIAYSMVKQSLDYLAGKVTGAANRTLHEGLVQVNVSQMFPSITDDQIVAVSAEHLDRLGSVSPSAPAPVEGARARRLSTRRCSSTPRARSCWRASRTSAACPPQSSL